MAAVELTFTTEIQALTSSPHCPFFESKMTLYLGDLNEVDGIGTAGEIVTIKYLKSNGELGYFMANVFFKKTDDYSRYGQPTGFLSIRLPGGDSFAFVVEAKPEDYKPEDALEIKRPAYMPTSWFWGDLSDTLIEESLYFQSGSGSRTVPESGSNPEADTVKTRRQLVQDIFTNIFDPSRQNPDIVTQQIENYLAFQNPTSNVSFRGFIMSKHTDLTREISESELGSSSLKYAGVIYSEIIDIIERTNNTIHLLNRPITEIIADRVSDCVDITHLLSLLMKGITDREDMHKSLVLTTVCNNFLNIQPPELQKKYIDRMLGNEDLPASHNLQNTMLGICHRLRYGEEEICRIITESNDTSRIQEANLTPEEEDTVRLFKNLLTIICDSLYAYHQQDFSSIFADLEQHKQFLEAHLPQQLGWLEHAKAAYELERSSAGISA